MSKVSKTERAEVYKDHRVQLLLSKFVSGEIRILTPIYDPKYGYRYPIAGVWRCGDEIGYGMTEIVVVGKYPKYGYEGF